MAGKRKSRAQPQIGGLAGWLLGQLRGRARKQGHLELLERIALAPRQSLALINAEGRRILVATSAEGSPAFYPLDNATNGAARTQTERRSRVSW